MKDYLISCSSPVDVDYEYFNKKGVKVLFYNYFIDGIKYEDIMGRNKEELKHFYSLLSEGKRSYTSQISIDQYLDYFGQLIHDNENTDIIHLELGTGMTCSTLNALTAIEILKEKYPSIRIEIIDSLCSSSGYGLLVDEAIDLKNQGKTIDEVVLWLNENKNKIHHQFFCTDLSFFKRSGRVTMMTAFFGTIMKACPIMHLDEKGKIVSYSKEFGKKNAIKRTIDEVLKHIQNGQDYNGRLWISHSNCLGLANALKDKLVAVFPHLENEIKIWDIGTIIGSHCGPGTVAVYFIGDERI